MIELQHVSKRYNVGGKPSFVLKDINLKIAEGEFLSTCTTTGAGCLNPNETLAKRESLAA